MLKRWLIHNKGSVAKRSITLRMIELGFAITVFELVAMYFSGKGTPTALILSALFQLLAWIGRFVVQPKLEAKEDAENKS